VSLPSSLLNTLTIPAAQLPTIPRATAPTTIHGQTCFFLAVGAAGVVAVPVAVP